MTTNTEVTTTNQSDPAVPKGPPRSVPLVGDEPAMREWAAELVDRARRDGVELTGDDGAGGQTSPDSRSLPRGVRSPRL